MAPPRSPRIARPGRDCSRLWLNRQASPTTTQIKLYIVGGSASDQPAICSAGMFDSPVCRPSASTLPNSIAIDSPQAMVLSGRQCPPSRSVSMPMVSADRPVNSSPIHGDMPCVVVSHAVA